MRLHLIKILEINIIEHFPQDPQYVISQKIFPIEVIAKEAKELRISINN